MDKREYVTKKWTFDTIKEATNFFRFVLTVLNTKIFYYLVEQDKKKVLVHFGNMRWTQRSEKDNKFAELIAVWMWDLLKKGDKVKKSEKYLGSRLMSKALARARL